MTLNIDSISIIRPGKGEVNIQRILRMRNETLVASSDRGVSPLSARIRLIGFQTPDHHNRSDTFFNLYKDLKELHLEEVRRTM